MSTPAVSNTGPGRPPDPGLTDRVHRAACRVYGRHGWRGFTIEAVAKEAAVGKASIYARWSSKEDLLTESLAAQVAFRSDVDTGDIRSDLTVLAQAVFDFYDGEYGAAALRLLGEARLNPDLGIRFEAFRDDAIRAARQVVRRAMDRGEVSRETDVSALLVAIFGGVIMQVVSTPISPTKRQRVTAARDVSALVDLVLKGVRT